MSAEACDRELAAVWRLAGAPRVPRLGCSTVAHERLSFCSVCVRDGQMLELNGWRLLALRED